MCRVAVLLRFDAAFASLSIRRITATVVTTFAASGDCSCTKRPRMQMEAMGKGAKILPRLSQLRGSLPEHVYVQVVTGKQRAH
jgi:hypothetical protein